MSLFFSSEFRTKLSTLLIITGSLALIPETGLCEYIIKNATQSKPIGENPELLQKISTQVSQISANASKALVFVSIYRNATALPQGGVDPFEFFFGPGNRPPSLQPQPKKEEKQRGGLGSGFIIDIDKGYVVTNNHVVANADEIELKLANNKKYKGKIIGRDKNTDIAVVQISDKNYDRFGLSELAFDDSNNLRVGDFVLAIGAPFGLESSLSFGVVSAVGRGNLDITSLGNFIQTDAAINPGNSGGPLLNMSGHIIGVNTAIYSRSGAYNGIGFAVPSNLAKNIAEQLINTGKIQRGYLGVWLQPIDEEMHESLSLPKDVIGALVNKVSQNSPAHKAGIEPGDVIAAIDGREIKTRDEVINNIGLKKPGSSSVLKVFRNGSAKDIKITVGKHPEDVVGDTDSKKPSALEFPFGLNIAKVNAKLQKQFGFKTKSGLIVLDVTQDSAGAKSGFRRGDVIIKAAGINVDSKKKFYAVMQNKTRALVWLERNRINLFINLRK